MPVLKVLLRSCIASPLKTTSSYPSTSSSFIRLSFSWNRFCRASSLQYRTFSSGRSITIPGKTLRSRSSKAGRISGAVITPEINFLGHQSRRLYGGPGRRLELSSPLAIASAPQNYLTRSGWIGVCLNCLYFFISMGISRNCTLPKCFPSSKLIIISRRFIFSIFWGIFSKNKYDLIGTSEINKFTA